MTYIINKEAETQAYEAISEHEIDVILATDDELYDHIDALLMDVA